MTNREIQDLLNEHHINATIQTEKGFIRIITDKPVPEGIQNRIQIHAPLATKITFILADKKKMPVPKSLEKWFKNTKTNY